mmetsp:Transcript_122531/g.192221  ORF Transcript_122531/g.192221 Transcript_122531/m.192221 type:complete len:319 (-) Transcript_122531:212-1168(-)|eukprot:CAMPEP_0169165926 /NCGR_PEP_ID=MMETSP1015-20121227/59675_1 /TAXON_ID=342587 /ORGANISM="Karlodinium micrum, Strain CCMP2283" /LENGTH=318 /DNA_ID=CAMNT_0009238555 /DNA_START=51 /DNA_END=1007 /DNA_ORIENTATION=+
MSIFSRSARTACNAAVPAFANGRTAFSCMPLRFEPTSGFSEAAAAFPVSLPFYPDDLAKLRKRIINFAVATTNVGNTPVIPPQGYLDTENQMWGTVFNRVQSVAKEHACFEYNTALEEGCAYTAEAIPDVSAFSARLERITGWKVAPVTGSLSALDFFAKLAVGQMPCTMYIRPHTKFAFTEDPDCVHELLGHVPALFIPSWSKLYDGFGATARRLTMEGRIESEAMDQLQLMYFAVVEKGLVRDSKTGQTKAIGASVISGTNELLHCMTSPEKHLPLTVDNVLKYGSTDEDGFMEYFFVGESVDHMAEYVTKWMDTL